MGTQHLPRPTDRLFGLLEILLFFIEFIGVTLVGGKGGKKFFCFLTCTVEWIISLHSLDGHEGAVLHRGTMDPEAPILDFGSQM